MKPLFLIILLCSLNLEADDREVLNKHNREAIYVFGHSHHSDLVDFIPSISEISGEELIKKRENTLGDTIQKETGVSSTGYGPNSGRPVIRGLDGDRIKVLQNGLGTIDASSQSVDHAIPIDMLTVDQVEIVRGPMGLLYESSAIGGVVNVITDRIHQDFNPGLYGKVNSEIDSAQPGTKEAAVLNYGYKEWMFHLDGSIRNQGELKVPGFARTDSERAQHLRSNEQAGEVANSFNKATNAGVGVSKIFNRGFAGVSYFTLDNRYGTVSETDVTIDMTQNKFDFHLHYDLGDFLFNEMRVKSTQANYKHIEFEGQEQGTVFTNRGNESRLELINKKKSLQGQSGLHFRTSHFSAEGDEAFLPSSDSTMLSAFTLQELSFKNQKISLGLRLENNSVNKDQTVNFGQAQSKNFLGLNASLGHQYTVFEGGSLNHTLSYTERSPTAQELFAQGPHIASSTYERGSSILKEEKALAFESSLKVSNSFFNGRWSLFYQHFNNYISLDSTGAIDSASTLAIYEYSQGNAYFYGAEWEMEKELGKVMEGEISLKQNFDYVRAQKSGNKGNLARITPPRFGLGVEYKKNQWVADLEGRYVFQQKKVAFQETATNGFLMLEAGIHYDFIINHQKNQALNIYARARNLLDEKARNHVSMIKNIAPLAGRNFSLGLQANF